MERVVKEDREEQEKLQAEARAATKVSTPNQNSHQNKLCGYNSDLALWPLTLQLQAWWKGCLVRQGIGSFRKAEEAKKGKRKEGKKKKKEAKKNEGKNKKWIFSNTHETFQGELHHCSCGFPVSVAGNYSQLIFLSLSCSHSRSYSADMYHNASQALLRL